jgi:hypothetical protein
MSSEPIVQPKVPKAKPLIEVQQEQLPEILWADFLATTPPNTKVVAEEAMLTGSKISAPKIKLHCENCDGMLIFSSNGSDENVYDDQWSWFHLYYTCRNCGHYEIVFSLMSQRCKRTSESVFAIKLGQSPPFAPRVSRRIWQLIGDDKAFFEKALTCESSGFGIGAFTYYRRIVDNQWHRLLDEVIKVAEKTDPFVIEILSKAKQESQFDKAVKLVNDAIPQSLRIERHNPITLLHNALSEGLHAKTDAECLEIARDIRLVLSELAERIANALKDHAELNKAVGRLANVGNRKAKGEPPPVKKAGSAG